jgi:hypothetical protein
VTYDVEHAGDLLGALGVAECPPFESYVDKLVDYAREHVRQRKSARQLPGSGPIEADDVEA